MAKLPRISGMKAVKAFNKAGWFVARQTGHTIMVKPGSEVTLSVLTKEQKAIIEKLRFANALF